MAFLVSPGVQVREIDVSNVVPAVSSSIGGYVGSFSWGPVDEVRTITSEKDLVSVFGEPSGDDTYLTSLSCIYILNKIKCQFTSILQRF